MQRLSHFLIINFIFYIIYKFIKLQKIQNAKKDYKIVKKVDGNILHKEL